MARHLHLDEGKVMVSLAKFRSKNGLWKWAGVWASAEHNTAAIHGGRVDRVEKLVAIRSNLKLFEPNADVSTQLDYDSEVDEMVVGSSTESEGETEPVDCENK